MGDQAHEALGLVGIEIVHHKMPTQNARSGVHRAANMAGKVGFGAGRTAGRRVYLPGNHIEIDDEGAGSMADILMLTTDDLADPHRKPRMFALQGLNPRYLISGEGAFASGGSFGCPFIGLTHRADARLALRIVRRGQPVTDAMRFEIGFF
jgi:hypothetical protein